jgi:adenosine kinase
MLIITGSIAYDYIMDFPGAFSDHILPEQIHNINLSFIVNKFFKRRGGTAGNVSYTLGLLQTPHTLFSYAGNDFDEYEAAFHKIGIDTSHVKIDKTQYTATAFAMADKKQNQIWGYFNGAAGNNEKLQLKTIAKKTDLVLIGPQGVEGSMSLVKQAIQLGIPYMFDPGFILTQVTNNDLELGLTHAKYIIGNDYEIKLITDRIKTWEKIFVDKGVITTLGEKGAEIIMEGKKIRIKPVKVAQVASTTGAGDAWRGGFLAGLERGFDLQTAGEMGAVAGSFAVEHHGTQEQAYTKSQFTKRYKDAYNKTLVL